MSDYYTESQMQRIEQAAYDGAMLEAGKEWERQRYEFGATEANLAARIAELEADKERLNSCESALISMVNQFFYSKAGENIFRHSFMSAEEEAAEYLVEHGIARWVGKNKSAICFDEVQE